MKSFGGGLYGGGWGVGVTVIVQVDIGTWACATKNRGGPNGFFHYVRIVSSSSFGGGKGDQSREGGPSKKSQQQRAAYGKKWKERKLKKQKNVSLLKRRKLTNKSGGAK